MERPNGVPSWRASLGLFVTAIAALLLSVAAWQAISLGDRAGADVESLNRELVAVHFQRIVFPLLLDVQRYRLETQLLRGAHSVDAIRSRIDGEMAAASNYAGAHDEQLEVLPALASAQNLWIKARERNSAAAQALDNLEHALRLAVLYHVEDASGLEYDTNRFAQDLADMAFAKLTNASNDLSYAGLLAQNAQIRGSIPIPQRVELAGHVSALDADGGELDFNGNDDWGTILAQMARRRLGSPAEAATYGLDDDTLSQLTRRLALRENADVVLRETPRGKAMLTGAQTQAATVSLEHVDADATTLLERMLNVRTAYEAARNRYTYGMIFLTAVMLIGIMLIVAEITARRQRNALLKARQESERLMAELARQHAERALHLTEAQFRAVFQGAAMGIAILDRNGAILDANTVFRNIYGENAAGVLHGHESEFAELMAGERDLFEFEQHVTTPAGPEAWTDSTVSLVSDEAGNPYFAIFMFRDLTELRRNERRRLHDMTHDALTGLPNRAQFEQGVREQFAQMLSSPESPFAVLFVDLDRFKDVNESLGHDSGDFVISQVGHRVRASVEAGDVVARLGGDEFAVLVRSLPDVLHVEVIARRILAALSKPIVIGSHSIFAAASIGIAVGGKEYRRGEDVMRDADIAMRYAKTGGGGRFAIFDAKVHARAEKRLQLTTDLRLALQRGEFALLYQPIVKLPDGELVGCEALLRWNHPTEGVISPAEFMPLAEQTGLVVPIGNFVLRTACRQLSIWKGMTGGGIGFPMNVNVSAAELLDPDFESFLLAAVREFGVAPSDLTLEITESIVLDAGTRQNALVERLRDCGFNICIDDFGTGYSSLRYLQQFKVDTIKIDRSFVSGTDGEVASEPIVRTLMTLAEAFDVRVVAEGVETERQRDVLRNVGCRYGQGYYYARPLSAQDLASRYASAFVQEVRTASA